MMSSRNILFSLVFSVAALALGGCGGGSNSPAAAAPGACAAGSVNTQYGCLPQANCAQGMGSYNGSCISGQAVQGQGCQQVPGQAPTVYTQYGCLPQGNCQPGQGAYTANGVFQGCVQGKVSGMGMGTSGCSASAPLMTAKGCLPQGPYCQPGYGVFGGQCFPSTMIPGYKHVSVETIGTSKSIDEDTTDETDGTYETDETTGKTVYVYIDRKTARKMKRECRRLRRHQN